MHRHGKEGVERRKNSTTHFSIKGLDPFGVCTKKEKKKKNNSNDKQYHLKKNVVTNQSEAGTVIPIRWQQQKNVFFFLKRKTVLWRKCTIQYAYMTNVIKRRRELSQSHQQDSVFRVVFRLIRRQYSKKKWIGHFFLWVSTCEKSQMQTFDLCITGEKKRSSAPILWGVLWRNNSETSDYWFIFQLFWVMGVPCLNFKEPINWNSKMHFGDLGVVYSLKTENWISKMLFGELGEI